METDLAVFGQGMATERWSYAPPMRPPPHHCPSCGAALGYQLEWYAGAFTVTVSHPGPVCANWPRAIRRLLHTPP